MTSCIDHLRTQRGELQKNREAVMSRLQAMNAEQRAWKPGPKSWCALEVVDHLATTARQYGDKIEAALSNAPAAPDNAAPVKRTLVGRMILMGVQPGFKMKIPAPKMFHPESKVPDEGANVRFEQTHDRLDKLMEQSEGLAVSKIKFGTPVSPLLRLTVCEAFEILALHPARHVAQLDRLTHHPDFPKSGA